MPARASKNPQSYKSKLPDQEENAIKANMSTTIRIAYDGEALRANTMNVRDFAPALLALSDLFDEANKVLNGSESAVQVRIRPDFRPGSFEVRIDVVYNLLDSLLTTFAGTRGSGLANLLEVVGFGGGIGFGLIKLVKLVNGRPVKKIELINNEDVRVTVDGDEIVVKRKLANVFNDLGVRRALAAVLGPLRSDGIDKFEIREDTDKKPKDPIETISSKELPAFEPPAPIVPVVPVSQTNYEQTFTIISLTFKDGNKWRVSDGNNTISVTIEDGGFINRVNNREVVFAKDDIIRCNVHQVQTSGPDGLKTNYVINRVLEHKHAPRQVLLPLPLDPPIADSEPVVAAPDSVPLPEK